MTPVTFTPETDSQPDRPLRRDAERNRRLVLEAAAQVFAAQGLDASFEEIARVAGVGVGTVYRRYPVRDDLIGALFARRLEEIAQLAETALGASDPWTGLSHFLAESTEMQMADRGLKEVLDGLDRGQDRLAAARSRLIAAVEALVSRAKADGSLRGDVEGADLGLLATMLIQTVTKNQPQLWRRYLVVMLDGLREARTSSTPLTMAAPSTATVSELLPAALHR